MYAGRRNDRCGLPGPILTSDLPTIDDGNGVYHCMLHLLIRRLPGNTWAAQHLRTCTNPVTGGDVLESLYALLNCFITTPATHADFVIWQNFFRACPVHEAESARNLIELLCLEIKLLWNYSARFSQIFTANCFEFIPVYLTMAEECQRCRTQQLNVEAACVLETCAPFKVLPIHIRRHVSSFLKPWIR